VIVVTDTSVVLNLCFLTQEGLLSALFEKLLAPSAVWQEFERLAREDARFQGLSFPSFISVEDPAIVPDRLRQTTGLNQGEIMALALAVERRIRDVLIDERAARRVAEELGLRVSGLLGVLLAAKRRRLIPALAPLIDQLQGRARFWIDPALRAQLLANAGEAS